MPASIRRRLFACLLLIPGVLFAENKQELHRRTVARIDSLIAKSWKEAGVTPAPPASDAEFLRRAYLDLTGRLPAVSEVRRFLDSKDSSRRQELIESLVNKPNHATHLARTWREFLLPQGADFRLLQYSFQFEAWLRGRFADRRPYDEIVRELLLARGQVNQSPAVVYYTSLQVKPEEIAASVSRSFLGTQIQCAQCHDHPFDHWKQKDFWGFAAFFAQINSGRSRGPLAFMVSEVGRGDVKLPGTSTVVKPKFLQTESTELAAGKTRRESLAEWLTDGDNPFFAKATVNRVWANLFGRGIVNPVDDLGNHNRPSHPELLDELADYFVATGFDLGRLYQTLLSTRAYQLASRSSGDLPPELFASMSLKPLTGAQLYDCISDATWQRAAAANNNNGRLVFVAGRFNRNRQVFVEKFRAGAGGEYQAGIPQALTMMNGQMINNATGLRNSDILISLGSPVFHDAQRVEILFLSTLSRKPTKAEREQFVKYVSSHPKTDRSKALGDVLWALLNSAEFTLNH